MSRGIFVSRLVHARFIRSLQFIHARVDTLKLKWFTTIEVAVYRAIVLVTACDLNLYLSVLARGHLFVVQVIDRTFVFKIKNYLRFEKFLIHVINVKKHNSNANEIR